jgi:hypothetical protein
MDMDVSDGPGRSKLDAPSRQRLRALMAAGSPPGVALFLSATAPLSDRDVEALARAGATVRTIAGTVLTADVPLEALDRVLEHPFIVRAQISPALYRDA